MMIINLNLLSPSKKTRNEHVVRFLFLKNLLEMSLLVAALLATCLLLSWVILQEEFNNLSSSTMLVDRGYSSYGQEIRRINKINHDVTLSGKNYFALSPQLLELIDTVPVEIKLNSLNIDRTNNKLVIIGVAKQRETLLVYQDRIKELSWVADLGSPTSQLFQKENVDFEWTIKIKAVDKTL